MKKRKISLLLVIVILGAFLLYRAYEQRKVNEMMNQIELSSRDSAKQAVDGLRMAWTVRETKDEMTDEITTIASVISQNSVNFDFPYNGGSSLTIYIRSKGANLDVYFRISQGQFVCNEYSGTDSVTIRFDEEEAHTYKTTESATGNSEVLFIKYDKDAKQILNKCRSAKEFKIRAPFFQEGSRVFSFCVNEPLSL